ncbi:MAG: hypothetical protein JO187_14515, partial [Acidobacteria bacterium]|nr:hypothetical protein [Acidobacteriota bacterium]
MRKYLMAGVATAALTFGVNQAMAQSSMGGGVEKQGTTSAQSTSKGAASEGSKTIGQARDQAESKGMQPSSKMGDRDKDKMGGNNIKSDQKMGAGTADQTKQNAQRDTDKTKSKTTTGQSRDEMKSGQSGSTSKMGAQPSTNQNNAQAPSSSSKMGQSSSGATTGSASSSATQLTTEQRTEVREKVLANAPRENNVNFAVNVGTVVP